MNIDSPKEPLLGGTNTKTFHSSQLINVQSVLNILYWYPAGDALRFTCPRPITKIELPPNFAVQAKWRWNTARTIQSPLHFESDWSEKGKILMKDVCTTEPLIFKLAATRCSTEILDLDSTTNRAFLDHAPMEITDLLFSRPLTEEEKRLVELEGVITYYNILLRWVGHGGREYTCYRYS